MNKNQITKHFKGIKISFEGSDSEEFLHRLCSIDIIKLKKGVLYYGAFLDKRARSIAPFYCLKKETIDLFISQNYKDAIVQYLNKIHFGEDLGMKILEVVWTEERYIQKKRTWN